MPYSMRGRRAWCVISFALLAITAPVPHAAFATSEEAESFNQSADQLLKKGDLAGAAIQLRNAIQKDPQNGTLRLKLAELDLRLGDPIAAEALAMAAKERGVSEELIAPVLAQALYTEGEYARLLKEIPAGDRAPKVESAVRTLRGLSNLQLGESAEAEAMLREAVKLDADSVSAKVALGGWLLSAGKLDEADQLADATLASAPESSQALTAKARVLDAKGNRAGALDKLTAAIDRDPNNLSARLARVGLLIGQKDLDGAQRDLDAVFARVPRSSAAIYFQALIQATKGDLKSADATLTKLGTNLGEPAESYYLAGVIKFRLGQSAIAEEDLTRYVARNPRSISAFTTLGEIALTNGKAKGAIDYLNRALEIAPGNIEALSILGQAYAALGDQTKALEAIESALKVQPANPVLQAQVALSHVSQGETTQGVEALEQVFHADEKRAEIGQTLVITALKVGEFEKAVSAAKEIVKTDPENILYQQLLGIALARNQDLPGAETTFRQLVDKHPELLPARRNLAEVYLLEGRGEEARKLFDSPLRQKPNDVVALSMLAEVDVKAGKVPEAIDALKRAQAAATNSAPGLRLVALFQSQNDQQSALAVAIDLSRRYPQDAAVIDALARAQIASGDIASGLSTYRQGTETVPDSIPLLDRYARALMANKKFAEARDVLQRELARSPGNRAVEALIVQAQYSISGLDGALVAARSFNSSDSSFGDMLAAQVLAENGKTDDGIKLLTKTLAEKPSSSVVILLAELYASAGQKDRAIEGPRSWMVAHPDDVAVQLVLARAYLDAHDDAQARSQYESLAKIRGSDPSVLNNLAWLYQKAGDARAKEVAERAYRLAPAPAIGDTLGWILTTQGSPDLGLKYLENAGKAIPDNLNVQYHLAVALQKTGKVDAARSILRTIVAKEVEFDSKADAKTLLSQLGG